MLYIGKTKDPFTGEIDIWKIDAGNAMDAQQRFNEKLINEKPFSYAVCDHWIEIADDQPEEVKTYAVFAFDHRTRMSQNNYPDTWEEAVDLANELSYFYDDIEICYGWPGHWQHADTEDEVGTKLYETFLQEANA